MMRDRAINMEARGLIIFSLLVAQAFSAPNGCIEFCTGQQNVGSSYETSSSYRRHSKVVQGTNVQGANQLNYDYGRPGNWTEHNDYVTDGGHGSVHEEKGQYVEGPKKVSYYRKNYSSSSSSSNTGDLGGVDVLQRVGQVPSAGHNVEQDYEYDRQRHRQQIRVHPVQVQVLQPVSQSISHDQRHDEFSQHQTSQTIQHGSQIIEGQSQQIGVRPEDNWRVVDSHRTDGGHGQVYEEHGQYVNGPSNVRYYRRNYTASYGTPGTTVVHQVPVVQDVQRHVEDIQRQYEDLRRRSEHLTNVHDVSSSGQNIGLSQTGHRQYQVESVVNVVPQPHVVTDEHSSEDRYQKTSTRRVYGQVPVRTDGGTQQVVDRLVVQPQVVDRLVVQPQVYPTQNVYRKEHHTLIEGQYQPAVAQPIIYVPSEHNTLTSTSQVDNRHLTHMNVAESSELHSGRRVGGISLQTLGGVNSNLHSGHLVHGQQTITYPAATTTGQVQQYEEHWKSAGHVKGTTIPQNQILRQTTLQNSGYGNEFHWVPSGQLTTGTIDLGQVATHSVDCTDEGAEHVSRYHRLYKRNVKTGRRRVPVGDYFHDQRNRPAVPATERPQTEDYTGYRRDEQTTEATQQQTHGFGGYPNPDPDYVQRPGRVPVGDRRHEDFNQQNEELQQHTGGFDDFSQQSPGSLEFGQHLQKPQDLHRRPAGNQHLEDFGQHSEDLEQQTTGDFDDFTQQSSANLEFGHHTQKPQTGSSQHVEDFGQHSDDLEQQTTGGFDDFAQQSSANLEFGHHTQKPQKPSHVSGSNQDVINFTQQSDTGGFDDFTQQTSGSLEFGQHTQKPQHSDDFTQQTSGGFEFGHQSQKPQTSTGNQHLEDFGQHSDDLEQQTGGFDDFSQHPSANLEFGHHTQKPKKPEQNHDDFIQQNQDLEQQTAGFDDDFSQHPSANLEFGHPTQKPKKPEQNHDDFTQQNQDVEQQTGGFDDFTQQTSGSLEFGQHTQKPQNSDDFTQQTSGDLEFGHHSQKPQDLHKRPTGNQHLEDFGPHDDNLEQQTGGFDDFSQQTSGNLEFGQHVTKPQKIEQGHDDFTQQNQDSQQHTGGFDDFTQQTSGNLEFGQHTQKPQDSNDFTQQTSGSLEFGHQSQKPQTSTGNQHLEDLDQHDLEQQTGGFDDFTQQTGNLEFGHHNQKPQKPDQVPHGSQHSDDFTQQTFGNLEFGQQTQKPQRPGRVSHGDQHPDDFTQQTSGNLEFGQQTQKPQRPGRVPHGDQHPDDFTQQTFGNLEFGQQTQKPQRPGRVPHGDQHPDDFTQQTSGNLEFGQQTQKPQRPGRVPHDDQQVDDFTQQTSGNLEFGHHNQKPGQIPHGSQHPDDFTQQTSGNLEFGQQTQKPQRPGRVPHDDQQVNDFTQQNEDLQQHTGGFDDFTQQTSGQLEFGQQTWKPGRVPSSTQQQTEDLQQLTGGFDDFTQQTSGNLEFGQQTQQTGQYVDDFTEQNQDFQQQTGGFDDISQQPSGHLEFGHEEAKTEKPVVCQSSICRKPAPKPTPKPRAGRGSRYGLETMRTPAPTQQQQNTWQPHSEGAQQVPVEPAFDHIKPYEVRGDKLRGDQGVDSTTQKTTEKTDQIVHEIGDEQQVQQTADDWGTEWHQRHKPSDLTSEYTQQQSRVPDFTSQSQTHFDQDNEFSQQQQATLEQSTVDQKQFEQYEQSQVPEGQRVSQGWEQQTDDAEIKSEPRILEAYGGSGPYDPEHDDNIFSRVTVNPSATLPPHVDRDPWIIREKPRQIYNQPPIYTTTTTTPEPTTTTTEAPPPSFWGRFSHKITSTFDKAKEKAKEVFG